MDGASLAVLGARGMRERCQDRMTLREDEDRRRRQMGGSGFAMEAAKRAVGRGGERTREGC